jgi:hypothetical protein
MGVEKGHFFLSQGGFVTGKSNYGDPFTRSASGSSPEGMHLPESH